MKMIYVATLHEFIIKQKYVRNICNEKKKLKKRTNKGRKKKKRFKVNIK